ncbi:hypothetical protein HDU67_001991 [Dinochytrium kinnereticum]|nr:hypothetical protein HDU67_001991 [Dinochytrium kinnereticum]
MLAFDGSEETTPESSPDWPDALSHLSQTLPAIESLVIAGQGVVDTGSFLSLAQHCGSTLKRLVVHETRDAFNNAFVGEVARFLKVIEQVRFGESLGGTPHKVTPALGVVLAKRCPRLAKFECGDVGVGDAVAESVMGKRQSPSQPKRQSDRLRKTVDVANVKHDIHKNPSLKPATKRHKPSSKSPLTPDANYWTEPSIFSKENEEAPDPLHQLLISKLDASLWRKFKTFVETTLIPKLQAAADPVYGTRQNNYLKNKIKNMGLKMPETTRIVKDWLEEFTTFSNNLPTTEPPASFYLSLSLFYTQFFELQFTATLLLEHHFAFLRTLQGLQTISLVFDSNLIQNWASCDALTIRALSTPLFKSNLPQADQRTLLTSLLKPWAEDASSNVWKRRAACVACLPVLRRADEWEKEFVMGLCGEVVKNEFRFCQTGVGWVMRDLSVSYLGEVVEWLKGVALPFISVEGLRYAVKKMPTKTASDIIVMHKARNSIK